jgi:hypothetical protein
MPYLNTIPIQSRVAMLNQLDSGKDPQDILRPALSMLSDKMALVSSFGADTVLLHMVAQIAPATPVLFIDTQMMFRATVSFQKQVAQVLGLTDVRRISPDPGEIFLGETEGLLHQADTDDCCALRKVAPLQRALEPFDAWITSRKQHKYATRSDMTTWEDDDAARFKLTHLHSGAKWMWPPILTTTTCHSTPSAIKAIPPPGAPLAPEGEAGHGRPCRTLDRQGQNRMWNSFRPQHINNQETYEHHRNRQRVSQSQHRSQCHDT